MLAYASSSNFLLRNFPLRRPWRLTRMRWNVCKWEIQPKIPQPQREAVTLTSHRLVRLWSVLWTACNSMLSVRRSSCRSLYMFDFAIRLSSVEKCDSSSSMAICTPQIGHVWPVADAPAICIGFFGPIPSWWKIKKKELTSINFCRCCCTRHNHFFINFLVWPVFRCLTTRKKHREAN